MPKLPHVSGKEAVRALERLGFLQLRQKGSHLIMRRGPNGCVVPLHREIKIGTLGGILKQAGVTPEEFIGAL
jgi:predicted RNA binding protein YcfA (HicA-like mRNA interferase family)